MNEYEKAIRSLINAGLAIDSMICYVNEELVLDNQPLVIEIDNAKYKINTIKVSTSLLNDIEFMILESGTDYEQGLRDFIKLMEVDNNE